MTALLILLIALFSLKIFWNLLIPYLLAWRVLQSESQYTNRISMATLVEIALLLACLGVASVASGSTWFHSPKHLAVWGLIAIVISYLHLAVGGTLAGLLVSRITRRRDKEGK